MEAERRNIVNELLENDKLIEYNEKAGSVDCQIGSSSAWLVVQRLFDFVCWMAAAAVWVTGGEGGTSFGFIHEKCLNTEENIEINQRNKKKSEECIIGVEWKKKK